MKTTVKNPDLIMRWTAPESHNHQLIRIMRLRSAKNIDIGQPNGR